MGYEQISCLWEVPGLSLWNTQPWSPSALVNCLDTCWEVTWWERLSVIPNIPAEAPDMWVRPSWTRQSWTQSRDACWHGRELKNHLAEPYTHSWPTESREINCCFKLLSSEVVQGGNRNTFHNEYQNYLSEPLMTCELGFSNWVKSNSWGKKTRLMETLT